MNVNKRYFDGLMAERRMSLRGLAAKMGMTHSQLSLTFSGDRRMQLSEAAQISQIFGVPLEQVAANAGVTMAARLGRRTTVIGALRGDGTVTLSSGDAIERVAIPDGLSVAVDAIQARTADSRLAWMDGWLIFVRSGSGEPTAAMLGQFCYAHLKDGTAVLATIRRGYSQGKFALSGPYANEGAELVSASPVLLIRP